MNNHLINFPGTAENPNVSVLWFEIETTSTDKVSLVIKSLEDYAEYFRALAIAVMLIHIKISQ
eukprot:5682237-Ditylum_brightwellii.AAC.1